MFEYLFELMKGLYISLMLIVVLLIVVLILVLIFIIILMLKMLVLVWLVWGYIMLFIGMLLLVQIFLIYYGLGQFLILQEYLVLWYLLLELWLCVLIVLLLNSVVYIMQLFYGVICVILEGQWQFCSVLGMSKKDMLVILLLYVFKCLFFFYFNEVVLVFKSIFLVYIIMLMEVMGYSQLLYGCIYDVMVFGVVGIIYLVVNGLLMLMMCLIECKVLVFEW